jgi:hypothetical protein
MMKDQSRIPPSEWVKPRSCRLCQRFDLGNFQKKEYEVMYPEMPQVASEGKAGEKGHQ